MDKDRYKDNHTIEKFSNDMGFEDCSITKNQTEESGLVYKNTVHKIEMECNNTYQNKYNCSASIKIDNDKIIKSNCEKQDSQED